MNQSLTGRIVKGIAGFYYVNTSSGVYECHAKGLFRKDKEKPLVGDIVTISVLDDDKKLGNLTDIHQRKNRLIRPSVANVDQAVIVFALSSPDPNLNLLDKFLIMMEKYNVETMIIFNKDDLVSEEFRNQMVACYDGARVRVHAISALSPEGPEIVRNYLKGKMTVLAGPSGVGKSTLINGICGDEMMLTGSISEKLERGKHTTRHAEIFPIDEDTFIMDTPGFTAFELVENMEKEEIKDYFPEFYKYEGHCKFEPCSHTHEPECAVKEAVQNGSISKVRYDSYLNIYDEIKNRRLYK